MSAVDALTPVTFPAGLSETLLVSSAVSGLLVTESTIERFTLTLG